MFEDLTDREYNMLRHLVHSHSDETILLALKELRKEHVQLLKEIEDTLCS